MTWLVDMIGTAAASVVTWVVAILVVLVLLLLVLRMLRSLLPGTYVRGGKSRHRLAVIDAAPVDARRRLVLVRRDGVEHLLLIGGAGDVVVESGIAGPAAAEGQPAPAPMAAGPDVHRREQRERAEARPRKPADGEPSPRTAAAAAPVASSAAVAQPPRPSGPAPAAHAPAPSAVHPAEVRQPEPVRHEDRTDMPARPAPARPERTMLYENVEQPPVIEPRLSPPAPPAPPEPLRQPDAPRTPPPAVPGNANAASRDEDEWTDEALMRELQETLAPVRQPASHTQPQAPQPAPSRQDMSLEEEMSQLLQDLTREGNKS